MNRFLVVILSFFAVHAQAPPKCRLEVPIPVNPKDLAAKGLHLRDVRFDPEPRFAPGAFDPAKDVLDLYFFNIRFRKEASGYLGAGIQVRGKIHSVGFAPNYDGDFQVEGSTTHVGDTLLYYTKHSRYFGKKVAVTELKMHVKNERLLSVQLLLPLFKNGMFTGQQETLCLKSVK